MYEECPVDVQMERMILKDGFFDESVYHCRIITYNQEEESIYILSDEAELPVYSLDAVYKCKIQNQKETVVCTGMIKERYWNKSGKVLKFQIQNGFYKNLVN